MTTTTDDVLELTTVVADPVTFTVDGEPYHMFTFEHLNKEQEARVQALFRRHTRELTKLNTANDDRSAEAAAAKNRETRIDIIASLTDAPRDVIESLPTTQQARLMREINSRMTVEASNIDDE